MGQCCCLAAGGLLSTRPTSSHFTHFPYATGVGSQMGGFAHVIGLCGPFKETLLRDQQFLQLPQPNWLLQPEVMRFYLPSAGNLGCTVCPRAGIAFSPGILPNFYPPHMNVGPPILPVTATSLWPHLILSSLASHLHPSYLSG